MCKKILFVVPYPPDTAPSQRLKFEQYYQALEQAGYEVHHESFISRSFWKIVYQKGLYLKKAFFTLKAYVQRYALLRKVKEFDIIYVHLWGTPFGRPVYERLLRRLAKRLIYDIDDLVYQATSSPNNTAVKFFKSNAKVDYLMKHADRTLVSTDKLMDYASKFTTKVSYIPATIDVNKYAYPIPKHSGPVVIGWSGSHTTSKYLHLLDDVLKTLSARHDIKIQVMGDPSFAIRDVTVELIPWTAETERQSLQRFDIGLHPLPDEEWVYGKSGGKLVQYMAAGIPIVASAIGPNFKAIENCYNGFLVSTEQEWIEKLSLLITDGEMRKRMGANSRKFSEEHYSIEANLQKYLLALQSS